MRKKISVLITLFFFTTAIQTFPLSVSKEEVFLREVKENDTEIYINNQKILLSKPAVFKKDKLFAVYEEELFRAIGAQCRKSSKENAYYLQIEKNENKIEIEILKEKNIIQGEIKLQIIKNKITVKKNGEIVELTPPPYIYEDRLMIPVLDFYQLLGCEVKIISEVVSEAKEVEKIPPLLIIFEPVSGTITKKEKIKISGKTEKDGIVFIDEKNIPLDSEGKFSAEIKLKKGENRIKIIAKDTAGNTTEKEIIVNCLKKKAKKNIVTYIGGAILAGILLSSGKEKKESPKYGSMKITSFPSGADVYVGSEYKGKTSPELIVNLPVGSYRIKVSKNGYKDYETEVIIETGKTKEIFVTLIPGDENIPQDPLKY